ncbi:MAG: hypothetical protein LBM38_05095 [Clostridiales bacterium]|jgi:hypothetical protein|nr:hypothetical protein [Clostridiales bacterium]
MSISTNLTQIATEKDNLKQSLISKGVNMSGVPFTNYHTQIDNLTTGGSGSDGGAGSLNPVTYNWGNMWKTNDDQWYQFDEALAEAPEISGYTKFAVIICTDAHGNENSLVNTFQIRNLFSLDPMNPDIDTAGNIGNGTMTDGTSAFKYYTSAGKTLESKTGSSELFYADDALGKPYYENGELKFHTRYVVVYHKNGLNQAVVRCRNISILRIFVKNMKLGWNMFYMDSYSYTYSLQREYNNRSYALREIVTQNTTNIANQLHSLTSRYYSDCFGGFSPYINSLPSLNGVTTLAANTYTHIYSPAITELSLPSSFSTIAGSSDYATLSDKWGYRAVINSCPLVKKVTLNSVPTVEANLHDRALLDNMVGLEKIVVPNGINLRWFCFARMPMLSKANLLDIINKSASGTGDVYLGTQNYYKLSNSERNLITGKGYTIVRTSGGPETP